MIDPCRSCAVALQRKGVARRPLPLRQHGVDLGGIVLGQVESRDRGVRDDVRPAPRADDDSRDARPVEHGAARHGRDVGIVPVGNAAERSQQFLK